MHNLCYMNSMIKSLTLACVTWATSFAQLPFSNPDPDQVVFHCLNLTKHWPFDNVNNNPKDTLCELLFPKYNWIIALFVLGTLNSDGRWTAKTSVKHSNMLLW